MQLIRWIKRSFIDTYKTIKLYKYYSFKNSHAKNKDKWIIYMADGKLLHGGLGDRLCGIISTYNYCKEKNITFKIHFVYPYKLEDILEPNVYDWRIKSNELSYNFIDSSPKYVSIFSRDYKINKWYVEKRLGFRIKKQSHIYSNTRCFLDNEFSILFKELFKPCKQLQEMINIHLGNLPGDYISLTFRFQQLLGDFKEGEFPTLSSDNERDHLIALCKQCVEYLYSQNKTTILVTSDSRTFLDHMNDLDYVYTIPGELRHMDYGGKNDDIVIDMKSYIDLYMLAHARTLYLCNMKPLFHSGFPHTASMILNRPYREILRENTGFYITEQIKY